MVLNILRGEPLSLFSVSYLLPLLEYLSLINKEGGGERREGIELRLVWYPDGTLK